MGNRIAAHTNSLSPYSSNTVSDTLTLLYKELKLLNEQRKNLEFQESPFKEFSNEIKNMKPHRKNFKLNFDNTDESKCTYLSPVNMRIFGDMEENASGLVYLIANDLYSSMIALLYSNLEELTIKMLNAEYIGSKKVCDKILFESVINEAVRLPNSSNKTVFYTCLLIRFCRDDVLKSSFVNNINSMMVHLLKNGHDLDPKIVDIIISIYTQLRINIHE